MSKDEKKAGGIRASILNLQLREIWKILIYAVIGPSMLYGLGQLFKYSLSRSCTNGTSLMSQAPLETTMTTTNATRPVFWIHAKSHRNEGYLEQVFRVLDRIGFQRGSNESDWDLLWAHDYPFGTLGERMKGLRSYQRVNHFPGCGYVTNKVDLSVGGGRYVPRSFKLPDDQRELLAYVSENPGKAFVQKSNGHRGIRVRKVRDMNLQAEDTFVQEFVERPYLVDGFKFDVGIYTVVTSINPLRLYVYKGDVLFRFCPTKYYPFDPEDLDKYVVGDDYLPIWKVPSLKEYYVRLGFSMKDSFDAYARSRDEDPETMWNHAHEAIREALLRKESRISEIVERFSRNRNFFELVRFDFTIDEDLNVFLMEANMSPNLSSAHYPPNRLLYEQVLFNAFALVGIAQRSDQRFRRWSSWRDREMEVADKNLVVLPELCRNCTDCFRIECQLCKPCFTEETRTILSQSYLEHQNKMDFKRIFPAFSTPMNDALPRDYTVRNQLLVRWYRAKCESDPTWCS